MTDQSKHAYAKRMKNLVPIGSGYKEQAADLRIDELTVGWKDIGTQIFKAELSEADKKDLMNAWCKVVSSRCLECKGRYHTTAQCTFKTTMNNN